MAYELEEIIETVRMTEVEHFDIRTVTLGISLRDCSDPDIKIARKKVYDKIVRIADKHVEIANKVSDMYGISIANKRIAVTPVSIPFDGFKSDEFIEIAKVLDSAAKEVGVDYLGGYSALVQKGYTNGDRELIDSIPDALSLTDRLCSSVNVASTKSGINIDAVNHIGRVVKEIASKTKDKKSIGCAKFVVFCNAVEDNPFIAGAFHGIKGLSSTALQNTTNLAQPIDFL
jgi:uncharacterized protein